MEVKKIVKEYGKTKRQRIDLNKTDGFNADEEVVLIPAKKYDDIKHTILELQENLNKKDKELQILQSQEQNLKQIVEDITSPIYEKHKEELKNKDDKINELELQVKALQRVCSQYNIQMSGLSAIDILFRKKHKDLIDDFNNNIWIINQDTQIEDIDLKKLPGNDDQQ